MIKYNPMTRRMFLQGAGGLMLTIPVLESLLPRAYAASPINRRFVQLLSYHGACPWDWLPVDQASTRIADDIYTQDLAALIAKNGKISRTLGTSFNPIASKISLIQGLDLLCGDIGEHSGSVPTTASLPAFGGEAPAALAYPYSIDCIMEDSAAFYPTRPSLGALRIAVETTTLGNDSVRGLGSMRPAPGFIHPLQPGHVDTPEPRWVYAAGNISAAFQSALGGIKGATPDAGSTARLLASSNLNEEYKRVVGSKNMSTDDKNLLTNYMDLLSKLRGGLQAASANNTCSPTVVKLDADAVAKSNEALCSAYTQLMVASLACGVTRLASWYIEAHYKIARNAAGGLDTGLIDGQDWHPHAHALDDGYSTYMDWHAKRVSELLIAMDAWKESDGSTLLDNSLVYYGSFMATGIHTMHSMPVLLAGGAGGKIRMGKHIDYRQRNANGAPYIQPVRNATLQKAIVAPGGTQATANIYLGRPYNNLLTTFMAAMGLGPADYEKFGQPGIGDYDPYTIKFNGGTANVSPGGSNRKDYLKYLDTIDKKRAALPYLYLG